MNTSLVLAALLLAPVPRPPIPETEGEEPRSLLAAVPADAVAFVQVRDLAGLRATAAKNAWGQMLHDPELLPFWERAWAGLDAELEGDGEDELGKEDVALLWRSLQGSAVVFFEAADAGPDFGVMIDPGAGRASFDEFLARVGSLGNTDSTFEEYAGVALELWVDENDQREAAAFDVGGTWCLVEAGSREAALETAHGMIDRLAGAAEASIEDNARLAEARAGSFPGRVELFVDVERLVTEHPAELDEKTARALDLLGLQRIPWVHGALDLGEGEDLDLHLRLALPEQGYLADWFGALGPLPAELAAFGPADSVSVTLYNLDLFAIYESIWDLVEDVDPTAYAQGRAAFEGGLQAFGGLDPEGDLLAQITGEFASFRVPVPEAEITPLLDQAMGLGSPDGVPEELRVGDVFVVGLEDADTVEAFVLEALDRLGPMLGLSSADVEGEEFQGHQIQSLALPAGLSFQWCFVEEHFLGSLYPSALRSSLALHGKPDAPSVRTHEAYAEHIERHASASMLGLAPSSSLVGMLFGAFEMGAGIAESQMAAGFDNNDSGEPTEWPFAGLDWPGPELARRYLRGTLVFELDHAAPIVELAIMAR
jgi:hypothetical protein